MLFTILCEMQISCLDTEVKLLNEQWKLIEGDMAHIKVNTMTCPDV